MLRDYHYNRLNLNQFTIGDAVILTLRNHPKGHEYYGIVESLDDIHVGILGKPLAWVLTGDLQLDKYNFHNSSIEDLKLYSREDTKDARAIAQEMLDQETINNVYDTIIYKNVNEQGQSQYFDRNTIIKYMKQIEHNTTI